LTSRAFAIGVGKIDATKGEIMIKDILVNLTVGARRDAVADYAVSVASTFQAHLTGVAFAHEPTVPGTLFAGTAAAVIASYRAEGQKAAEAARDNFEGLARDASVLAEGRVIGANFDASAGTFSRIARTHDLSIVRQARPDQSLPEELIIEAALFQSGRPVLVVPYIQRTGLKLDRVMVCWDGSRNAARALADAMPLLQRAGAINVVTIETREHKDELAGAEISQHLARHRLRVQLNPIVAKDIDVASTILSFAADSSTDMIVMGGYGHSRLREFVLGGATRGMLESMTVPTLMAH
jgi:nucleotide-binding universal stress UspA family protein